MKTALHRHFFLVKNPMQVYDDYTKAIPGKYIFYPYQMLRVDRNVVSDNCSLYNMTSANLWKPNGEDDPEYKGYDTHPVNTFGFFSSNFGEYAIHLIRENLTLPLTVSAGKQLYDRLYSDDGPEHIVDIFYGEVDTIPAVYFRFTKRDHILVVYSPSDEFELDDFTRKTLVAEVLTDEYKKQSIEYFV